MSARDKLVELVLKNEPDHGNTMFIDLFGCAMSAEEMKGAVLLWLDAYRAEVLREAAALQRLRMEELDLTGQKARVVSRFISLIDPDTP